MDNFNIDDANGNLIAGGFHGHADGAVEWARKYARALNAIVYLYAASAADGGMEPVAPEWTCEALDDSTINKLRDEALDVDDSATAELCRRALQGTSAKAKTAIVAHLNAAAALTTFAFGGH